MHGIKKVPTPMDYAETAREARRTVLRLIYEAQTSHIGSNFSCIDILTVLFSKIDLDKDKFVLSAGWKAASLYFFLYKAGRITEAELNSYCKEDSKFIGLAEPIIPDIQIAGGSMGLGFPGAVGLALAKNLKGEPGTVWCLMSDGEMQSGTTWEAAMIASQFKLNNLHVIVDCNGFQAMGKTNDIMRMDDPGNSKNTLANKWASFGWLNYGPEDGHNFESIERSLFWGKQAYPIVSLMQTVKGKGVSFMENDNIWHYKAPEKEEYERAIACLQ